MLSVRLHMSSDSSMLTDNCIQSTSSKVTNRISSQRLLTDFHKGALQTISVPPSDTFIPTLYGQAWAPSLNQPLVIYGHNPNQAPELNLKASAVTRVVGGMATHWTCACPLPHAEERKINPIASAELDELLLRARGILDVNTDQYDDSIRHNTVLDALKAGTNRNIQPLPLAVRRRAITLPMSLGVVPIPSSVTLSGSPRFTLSPETRVTEVVRDPIDQSKILGVLVRDLKTDTDHFVVAKAVVIACGAVGTPQVLYNSHIRPWALGRFMTEQSLSFCQVRHSESLISAFIQPAYLLRLFSRGNLSMRSARTLGGLKKSPNTNSRTLRTLFQSRSLIPSLKSQFHTHPSIPTMSKSIVMLSHTVMSGLRPILA
jgi:pyranose oxidase